MTLLYVKSFEWICFYGYFFIYKLFFNNQRCDIKIDLIKFFTYKIGEQQITKKTVIYKLNLSEEKNTQPIQVTFFLSNLYPKVAYETQATHSSCPDKSFTYRPNFITQPNYLSVCPVQINIQRIHITRFMFVEGNDFSGRGHFTTTVRMFSSAFAYL